MTIPTTSWDETSPAGSSNISLGDNRIREMKTQIREVLEVDHKFESSGQNADNGKHKKVSLIEQADLGTGTSGEPILGGQTVSGKPELVYTDEDNNDVQLTTGGKLCTTSLTTLASISTIMNLIYPVGTVLTFGVSTNPATLLGIGTWTAIAGRVIVGIDAGQTEFDTLDETGGSKTHTLTTDEIPSHRHACTMYNGNGGGTAGFQESGTQAPGSGDQYTQYTGGGSAHNNLQPYIVKYVYQRTA